MGTAGRVVEPPEAHSPSAQYLSRRKFSIPVGLTLPTDSSLLARRRFSNVGDVVSRKFSTTIGWRRPPEDVIAVGRALCTLYIRNRLKRANLFNRKLGFSRVRSAFNTTSGVGGITVRDVFPGLVSACIELERTHPRLYTNIARQTGMEEDAAAGSILVAIGHHIFRVNPTWGKVVAVFSIAGGLAVDFVRQGQSEQIHDLLEGMSELLEDKIALWVASNGGWINLNSHFHTEHQDVSFFEYLAIFTLVLLILLIAYIAVKFFLKFSQF